MPAQAIFPRKYQLEALKKALEAKRCVIVLPTGTGKTLVAVLWAKELLEKGKVRQVLFIEPTRILVEQVAEYIQKVLGKEPVKLYGLVPREKRARLWREAQIIVATAETAWNDKEAASQVDAVVLDECHHAVGEDAYLKFLQESAAEYRLGLTAFVPRRIRHVLEQHLGPIYSWPATHPDLQQYLPAWIGSVYETWFNKEEQELYSQLEQKYFSEQEKTRKMILRNCLKYYSRDGLLALRESYMNSENIRKLLYDIEEKIFSDKLRELHKLETFVKVLETYDFAKAIVFLERVVVAERLAGVVQASGYSCVVLRGRQRKEEVQRTLEQARQAEVIISTSAGEEGLDLPEADLLVVWSNISSPLRFVQRHGRIMRGKGTKYVAYLVTPGTVDLDMFIDGIEAVKRYVDVNVDKEVLERFRRYSPRARLLAALEFPMPLEWLQEITGMTQAEARKAAKIYAEAGELFYIYTHLGKLYFLREHIAQLEEQYKEYLTPKDNVELKVSSEKLQKSVRGKLNQVIEKLIKELPLPGIRVTVKEIDEQGVERLHYLIYDFLVPDKEILEVVLKNACAAETLKIY
ncbi:MAG: DEAD/DEAH box helicase family protein [bacterium]|nr:DEAD/DEAH box helicase family protein [bacterium]